VLDRFGTLRERRDRLLPVRRDRRCRWSAGLLEPAL